jgi:hypothetical protein
VETFFVLITVHQDINRSGKNVYFFPPILPRGSSPEDVGELDECYDEHKRRLERILYVFGWANRQLGYLQGFNELLCPIYYANCQAKQFLNDDLNEVEALSFYELQRLITSTQIQEFYSYGEGNEQVTQKFVEFGKLIERHVPEVAATLVHLDITPLHFGFRWMSLLFAQEHQLPTVLILWDALFARFDDLMNFSFYVGIAHVDEIKAGVRRDSFTGAMQALRNVQIRNIYQTMKYKNVKLSRH